MQTGIPSRVLARTKGGDGPEKPTIREDTCSCQALHTEAAMKIETRNVYDVLVVDMSLKARQHIVR